MPKHAKLRNPSAASQHVIGAAVQSNKIYLPPLGSIASAGIAAQQISTIC
jgi:hypothetical protein